MSGGPRFSVRRSAVHGRGVFARQPIPAGERLLRYAGEIITWRQAVRRYERTGTDGVTYFFDRDDKTVIDGAVGGNSARFFNHSCRPNCEAVNEAGTVWIYTRRSVAAGDELMIDYSLTVDDADDPEQRRLYACRCGHPRCRGTMLAVDQPADDEIG